MRRDISGFSLIEIAIVLIIIGLISGMALPALISMRDWQKATTTAQNQEKILYALASYAIQNKSLPYAANPTNFYGKQDISTRRRRGIVPYADLGLPESVAKDGSHHWITYVVDHDYATLPEKSHGKSPMQQLRNKLCEMPQSATYLHLNPLHIKDGQKHIALALISHGAEGRGAYPDPLGSGLMGSDEKQNATSDKEIIDRPISQDPQDPFSHKVVWVTASNLLATYGRSPCPPVEEMPTPSKLRLNWGEEFSQKK
jgi:prepilin-type N-terminal cleavage/methylation domain-containing protein